MREFVLACDAAALIDCVIASAGVTMVTRADGNVEDLTKSRELFDVNLNGVMNTIAPIAPLMRRRRAGQIALFGSMAAFAPPPDSPSYAASKAALVAFALATRALYRADGVSVSVICPGFVDTPMTASYVSWKPFLITAEEAARRIRRGLERRKADRFPPAALPPRAVSATIAGPAAQPRHVDVSRRRARARLVKALVRKCGRCACDAPAGCARC